MAEICTLHGKKADAFCWSDKDYLCIECLLSASHKSHEVISIQKGLEREEIVRKEISSKEEDLKKRTETATDQVRSYLRDLEI